jgi:hypothetical protein
MLLVLAIQSTGRVEILVRDASTSEGIPGVPVSLTFRLPNEPSRPPTTLITDPRGVATFSALSVGSYAVSIGEGYQAQAGSLPASILIDPGTQRRVEIAARRIANVTGRIVDPNGAPSQAAVLGLLSPAYVEGGQALRSVARMTIDREGRFRMTGIPFGEYYLRIENQSPWRVAYYPGVADPAAAQRVVIRDHDLLLGDITLPNAPGFKVSGSVFHSPSDAARSLTLYIAHDNPGLQEEPLVASTSSLRVSPAELRFELDNIPAGSYVIYPVLGDRALGSLGRENLRIEDSDIRDLSIAVKPMVGIAGRIVVKDGQSRLPDNLRIATPSRDTFPPLLVSDLSRGAIAVSRSGEFAVRNLIDGGRYSLLLQGLPPAAYISDIRLGSRSILSDSSFIASLTEEFFEIQISMAGGIVRGGVRDATGKTVDAASVVAVPDFARRKNPAFFKRTTTDSRGQFTIQGLAPGEYQLFAWSVPPPQGAEEDPSFLGPFESRSTRVNVNVGVTAEASLRLIQ